jgi:hypothetical protein
MSNNRVVLRHDTRAFRAPCGQSVSSQRSGEPIKNNLLLMVSAFSIVLAITIWTPSTAHACQCMPPGSPAEALQEADTVFVGKELTDRSDESEPFMTDSVVFEVSRVWKGISQSQIIVRTGQGGGDCGLIFGWGGEYLVYAVRQGSKNELYTNICSRTARLENASDDLKVLGVGKPPSQQVTLASPYGFPQFLLLPQSFLAVLLLPVLLGLGLYRLTKYRRRT